ncbi:MAG: hypothetical protein CL878_05955 [Dehalococcoidia bacterium]|nr:hypothetical protein [Dehalococcoidia bacterium]
MGEQHWLDDMQDEPYYSWASTFQDVAVCLKRQGFKRLIVMSTHGGNWILKPTIRELNMWDPDFQVM